MFVVEGQEGEFFGGAGGVEGGDCLGEGGGVEAEFGGELFDCGGGFGFLVGCVEDPAWAELGGEVLVGVVDGKGRR